MELISFTTSHFSRIFWKIRGIFRAMIFAYNNPRHVQVSVTIDEDEFLIESNYSGLSEKGHLHVLKKIGKEVEVMEMTEREFKNMMN